MALTDRDIIHANFAAKTNGEWLAMLRDATRTNQVLSENYTRYVRDKRRAQALVAAETARLNRRPASASPRFSTGGVQTRNNTGRVSTVW